MKKNLSVTFKNATTPVIYEVQSYEFHTFGFVAFAYQNGDIEYLNLDSISQLKELA